VLTLGAVLAVALLAPVPADAYEALTITDGGTLIGTVKFAGTAPRLPPLRVNKNRDVCGDEKESEALVLGADRGVRGSAILLEGVTRGKKGGADVVVDTHRCLFVRHVTVTMPSERTRVTNSDPVLHNTHGLLGKTTVFNLALPSKDQMIEVTRRLTRPGVVRVLCDAHPHMWAWMIVHDSPYYAVSDERGAYKIDGIPPGSYRVTMWHEGFHPRGLDKDGRPLYEEPHTITRDVTIPANGTATVDFELK